VSPAALHAPNAWLDMTVEAEGSATPAVVIERVNYAPLDGVERARQVTVAGTLKP
jgi:hypothetical protein